MKSILSIIIINLFIFNILVYSQETVTKNEFSKIEKTDSTTNSITFKLSDVKLSTSELLETTYKRALERRINRVISDFPESYKDEWICPVDFNAFVAAIHFSYCDHRPLIISPDMIWLTICQGVSIHFNENYDELKEKIVDFTDIKEITVRRDDFLIGQHNNWNEVFDMFADSVKFYTKDSIYNLFVPTFSTTGNLEHTAYVVTLLEATKNSFSMITEGGCGIPEITLEGNTEDWKWIRNNIEKFRKYDLNIWIDNLIPILDEIINTSEGNINIEFWESIYKYTQTYDGCFSSGWILKLFPYCQEWKLHFDKEYSYRYLEYFKNPFIENMDYIYSTITTDNFPNGYSKYEFIWDYQYTGEKFDMEVYAGFMGVKQNKETKSLKPVISWALINADNPILDDNIYANAKIKEPENFFFPNKNNLTDSFYIYEKPVFNQDSCSNYYEGILNLTKYINREISKNDTLNKLNGYVKVKFIVSWEGKVTNCEIIKGTSGKEDEVAKQIIENLPKWKPAKVYQFDVGNDYFINYYQTITLNFDINE